MKLTAKTAQKIADSYNQRSIDAALQSVLRRHGGLCAVLTDDARRDLILTLGDNRRAANAFNARQRARFAGLRAAAE